MKNLAYITIGTGCGVGIVINGNLVSGLQHPEGGHIKVSKISSDKFEGNCPIHKDCLEGLITNGALMKRKNLDSVLDCEKIHEDDEVWEFLGNYLAQLCLNLLYIVSVEKILIGKNDFNNEGEEL